MDVEPKVDSGISAESSRSRLTLRSLGRFSYSLPKAHHLIEYIPPNAESSALNGPTSPSTSSSAWPSPTT